MNRLKKDQKAKLNEFRAVSGPEVSNTKAIEFLKAEDWNLQNAINRYFNAEPVGDGRSTAVDAYFDTYAAADSDTMEVEDVLKWLEDLGITHEDTALIAFAWKCQAKNFSQLTREEFRTGCEAVGATNITTMKSKIPALRALLDDPYSFERIYNFCFAWACEPGKKFMDLQGAIGMWRQLFVGRHSWPMTEDWCSYLEEHSKRPMTSDTWRLLLLFKKKCKDDFESFDETEAWPSLIDDFVIFMQEKRKA